MQLPSFAHISAELRQIALRFPTVCLVAVFGTLAMVYYLDQVDYRNHFRLLNLVITSILGIPTLLALTLKAEQYAAAQTGGSSGLNRQSLVAQLAGIAILAVYYFTLPQNWDNTPTYYPLQYALFIVAAHFAVAFAPFGWVKPEAAFWQYNKTLFLRILTAVLYSGVLYLGLVIALLSIDNLFNANIDEKIYAQLFVLIGGIFNTLFFLSGVPDNPVSSAQNETYPKGLKIFTQYVLVPLVTLYLVILYSYMGKIIIEANLPKGWVSYLILGYATVGIFALLLIHPIKDDEGNAWIKTFSRWFYLALVPLLVLLYIAALRRVFDYGITELRYLLLALAVWLTGITAYFLFSKVKNIKILPITFCIITLFSSFGPWGASGISKYSQQQRMFHLLRQAGMLNSAGKIDKLSGKYTQEQATELSMGIDYLYYHHGKEALTVFFEKDFNAELAKDSATTAYPTMLAMRWLGLDTLTYASPTQTNASFYVQDEEPVAITGYDLLLNNITADLYYRNDQNTPDLTLKQFAYNNQNYQIIQEMRTGNLQIRKGQEVIWQAALDSFAKKLADKYGNYPPALSRQELTIEGEGKQIKVLLLVNNMAANTPNNQAIQVTFLSGSMLINFE